jgi:chemotaxis protein MotB
MGPVGRRPGGVSGTADDLPMLGDSQFDLVALPAAPDPTTEAVIIDERAAADPALEDDGLSEIRRYYQRRERLWGVALAAVLGGAIYLYIQNVPPLQQSLRIASSEAAALRESLQSAEKMAEHLTDEKIALVEKQGALEQALSEKEAILAEQEAKLAGIQEARADLEQRLAGEIAQGDVSTREFQGTLVVDLVDKVLFKSGEAELDDRGKAVLAKVADSFRDLEDKFILIGGHTDNVPIKPPLTDRFPTNWELSTARALAVVHYLSGDGRIPGDRLGAQGFGEHRPVGDNRSNLGRRKNRRIEVVLAPKPATAAKVKAASPAR